MTRLRFHGVAYGSTGHEPVVITGRWRPGGADRLLRHSLSGALRRAGSAGRPAICHLRILGFRSRKLEQWTLLPGAGTGLDELRPAVGQADPGDTLTGRVRLEGRRRVGGSLAEYSPPGRGGGLSRRAIRLNW